MTEQQIKEIEQYIASHIGVNNPNAEKLKNLALKFYDYCKAAKDIPVELRPLATLILGLIMKNE